MPWTCPTCAHVFDVGPSRPVEAKAEAGESPQRRTAAEWKTYLDENYLSFPDVVKCLSDFAEVERYRPAPAYALREDFLAFCEVVLKWLDAPMGFRAVSLEDIHAMTRKHISALRQSAKEGT